jgi:hypothetical protein
MPALTRRYVVTSLATEAPFDAGDPDGAFVLKPWKDAAALRALRTYRDNCFPELRRDLDAWIRVIEAGPSVRGDVGRRNEPNLQRASGTGRGRPAARTRRAAPKASRPAAKKPTKKRRR